MIGALTGKVAELGLSGLMLECASGVSYELEVPIGDLASLQNGLETKLWTHMVVREDAQLLFGFTQKSSRELFRTLIKISGVGPKLALTMLSHMSGAELAAAVESGDAARLSKVPGIGKKTAERMIIELRGKLDVTQTLQPGSAPTLQVGSNYGEAQAALLSLGYNPKEAERALASVDATLSASAMIRAALKGLAK